jgi:HK97 family phage prohead protease
MEKILFRAELKSAADGVYSAIASTKEEDRDGEIVLPSSFTNLDNFVKQGGPIYYQHAWHMAGIGEESMPVGKTVGAWANDDQVGVKFVFADGGPMTFASKVKWMVDNGFLRHMSIGALPIKTESDSNGRRIYTEIELLEVSVVGIPSNRSAEILLSAKAAGIKFSDDETAKLFGSESLSKSAPDGVKRTEDGTGRAEQSRILSLIARSRRAK